MEFAAIITFALRVSIFLTVFAMGLAASLEDATYLLRRPGKLVRALLAMNVVALLAVILLALAFGLRRPVEIALVALALSPMPPFLPKTAMKAGGERCYTLGLLAVTACLSLVTIPLSMYLLERSFGVPLRTPIASVANLVGMTVLIPLALGIAVRRATPGWAERAAPSISRLAAIALVISILPLAVRLLPACAPLIGNGTLAALALIAAVCLTAGHLLGGPDPDEQMVLALATASRHPGVAIAIVQANFPEQKLAPAAVVLYMVVNAIAWVIYRHLSRRPVGHERPETPRVTQ